MLTGAEMMERLKGELPEWVEDIEVREYVDSIGDDAIEISIYMLRDLTAKEMQPDSPAAIEVSRLADAVTRLSRDESPELFPYTRFRLRENTRRRSA